MIMRKRPRQVDTKEKDVLNIIENDFENVIKDSLVIENKPKITIEDTIAIENESELVTEEENNIWDNFNFDIFKDEELDDDDELIEE